MAGAKTGVHVVQLREIQVPESLIRGNKFIKWDDVSFTLIYRCPTTITAYPPVCVSDSVSFVFVWTLVLATPVIHVYPPVNIVVV